MLLFTILAACTGTMTGDPPGDDGGTAGDGGAIRDARTQRDGGEIGIDAGLDDGGRDASTPDPEPEIDCAVARCFFVREGASGDGSDWASAFSTLPAELERGAVYFVAGGTYPGRRFDEGPGDAITIRKATRFDHGTDAGWDDAYGEGRAVFEGRLRFDSSDWIVDGVTGGGPGSWTSGFGFEVFVSEAAALIDVADGADRVTLRYVELRGTSNSDGGGSIAQDAVAIRGARDFTLSYFYTHDLGRAPFFLVPAPDSVIEYGYIGTFVSTPAQHSEVVSAWAWSEDGHFTFRYNVVAAITGTGGIMWDNSGNRSAQARIYGNVFYRAPGALWENDANGLIGGWTGGAGEDCYGLRVYNNSFVRTTGRIFTNFITRSGDNEVVNNLFYESDSPDYADIQTHDHNHYIASGGDQGEPNGTAAASGDPFVDSAGLDFALREATANGRTLGSPYTEDALAAIRGADGVWDRGAYERVE
jgi:hypothetical protein